MSHEHQRPIIGTGFLTGSRTSFVTNSKFLAFLELIVLKPYRDIVTGHLEKYNLVEKDIRNNRAFSHNKFAIRQLIEVPYRHLDSSSRPLLNNSVALLRFEAMFLTQLKVQKPQLPLIPKDLTASFSTPALIIHSPSEQSLIPLIGKRSWIIGRNLKSDIVIRDRLVSRKHDQLRLMETRDYNLVDLGSGNGSFLNGLPVTMPVQLHDGDRLYIGQTELEFHCPKVAVTRGLTQTTPKRVLMVQSKQQRPKTI